MNVLKSGKREGKKEWNEKNERREERRKDPIEKQSFVMLLADILNLVANRALGQKEQIP